MKFQLSAFPVNLSGWACNALFDCTQVMQRLANPSIPPLAAGFWRNPVHAEINLAVSRQISRQNGRILVWV